MISSPLTNIYDLWERFFFLSRRSHCASVLRWWCCCCLGARGLLHVGGTHQNNETLCGSALTAAAGFSSSPAQRRARRDVALNHSLLQQLATHCKEKKEKKKPKQYSDASGLSDVLPAVRETLTPTDWMEWYNVRCSIVAAFILG